MKPSLRTSKGYRLYDTKNLLRLQQIVALKSFGFELSQISELLENNSGAIKHFKVRATLLKKKSKKLLEASNTLKAVIANTNHEEDIPCDDIIKLIEVYNMEQNLEHSGVKEIFTPDELKEYATFESEWKNSSTPEKKAAFEKAWADLVKEISDKLKTPPTSEVGISIGKKCMELINGIYRKKYAHLRTKKFEKGFGEGKGVTEVGLTKETVDWLDK